VLVVALGINDALRGLPVEHAETALQRILDDGRSAGARLVLVGFRPHGSGDPRLRAFEALYVRLAAERKLALVPDLLEGVAGHRELMFADGLHPNAAGQQRLAENVRPPLELVLAEIEAGRR
jgi:acyl-CoA thioesterase-1